jgi:hypothetical protein
MSLTRTLAGLILLVALAISVKPAMAQPQLSVGPGFIVNDNVQKGLVGITGSYRLGRVVPNVIASWSDPWGWEPNIIRAKVGYGIAKHRKGVVLLEAGADALRIRDDYEWFGAATLTSVYRANDRWRWISAAAYRPENNSWAIIMRFNVVLWSGK